MLLEKFYIFPLMFGSKNACFYGAKIGNGFSNSFFSASHDAAI
jgi:hypothetical protein